MFYSYRLSFDSVSFDTGPAHPDNPVKYLQVVYAVIPINQEYAGLLKARKESINKNMAASGIDTLSGSAFDLLVSGTTSLEEVYPVLLNGL